MRISFDTHRHKQQVFNITDEEYEAAMHNRSAKKMSIFCEQNKNKGLQDSPFRTRDPRDNSPDVYQLKNRSPRKAYRPEHSSPKNYTRVLSESKTKFDRLKSRGNEEGSADKTEIQRVNTSLFRGPTPTKNYRLSQNPTSNMRCPDSPDEATSRLKTENSALKEKETN